MMSMDAMLARAEAYVGTPYVEGVFDCADLAARVQQEVFGRLIALPTHRKRPAGAMGQAREIRALQAAIATPIELPVTGCGVLMYQPLDKGMRWHIGTAFVVGHEVWVLHNSSEALGACLQRLDDLQRQGTRLEGYYAWTDDKGGAAL